MSSVPAHIVRRLVLELSGIRETDSRQFQKEISELLSSKILPLLDKYLSAHSPDEALQRIESLELDLGIISRDNLEKDLIENISRQLETYFQPQPFSDSGFSAEKEEISDKRSHLELFSFYVETGNLPWWVDSEIKDPVGESLDYLIRNDESALRHLMYEWVRQPDLLKRIVIQTNFPKWTELAAINLNRTGAELKSIVSQLTNLLTETISAKSSTRIENPNVSRLINLLVETNPNRPSAISRMNHFSQLLNLLAETASWKNYPKYKLHEILGVKLLSWVFLAPRKTQLTTDFWHGFLVQLATGQSITQPQQPIKNDEPFAEWFPRFEENKQDEPDRRERKDDSDIFVWKNKTSAGNLQEILFDRIKRLLKIKIFTSKKKTQWLELLQKLNEQAMTDEELQAIVKHLEQETSESDETEINSGNDSRKEPDSTGNLEPSKTFKVKIQQSESFKEKENSQSGGDDSRKSRLPQRPDAKKKKSRFSETDELFIGNAGLVILYPFLTRFFENLNLVEDRRFVDEAAAHRAAGLLQFLADGQEIPSEYRCGLNKILCGLDAEIVLKFGEPLTAEETEACELLLEAVIVNAPVLGEMSIAGFRGSFLLRKGILRAGVGAWQLNVERETYDIVLERFSWNWNIVKLPWMQWAMGAEWI